MSGQGVYYHCMVCGEDVFDGPCRTTEECEKEYERRQQNANYKHSLDVLFAYDKNRKSMADPDEFYSHEVHGDPIDDETGTAYWEQYVWIKTKPTCKKQ